MERITNKHLAGMIDRLNRITGNPDKYATRNADGSFTIHVGNYHLDSAYGGYKLVQTVTTGGGVRDVLHGGYSNKRACYELIYAYLCGIEEGKGV